MQEMVLRYDFKLRVSKTNEQLLLREAGRVIYVWNQTKIIDEALMAAGETSGLKVLARKLTEGRSRVDWLAEGSQVVQQQTIRKYLKAKQDCFKIKDRGFPKFKSRKTSRPSLEYTINGFSLKEVDGRIRLCLAGGIVLPVVWSRELPSTPKSVIVSQDAVGDWFASFVVRRPVTLAQSVDKQIGIDWGVKSIAVTTDPEFDLECPEFRKKAQKEIAKYQRMMARRYKRGAKEQSKGYKEAKRKAAKAHRKAVSQRLDGAHKWAKSVVDNHEQIAVEDFKPKFLAKSTMARKSTDNAVGLHKPLLIEKAGQAGREIKLVKPAWTTQTCSQCGTKPKDRIKLNVRIYECQHCDLVLDRDLNAARNILAWAGFDPIDNDESKTQTLSSA